MSAAKIHTESQVTRIFRHISISKHFDWNYLICFDLVYTVSPRILPRIVISITFSFKVVYIEVTIILRLYVAKKPLSSTVGILSNYTQSLITCSKVVACFPCLRGVTGNNLKNICISWKVNHSSIQIISV